MAGYHGTLAAARNLGAAGIPIAVADAEVFAPARWSRFVRESLYCPPVQDADRFVAWLLEFGACSPGYVLYPTSDDMAWLLSLHRGEMARHFRLYQPPVETLYALLDKLKLYELCRQAGIDTPPTWRVESEADLERPPSDLKFPLLVKPRTQVLLWPHLKGAVASCPEDLIATYRAFVAGTQTAPALLRYDPDAAKPILQTYYPQAMQSIYNLCGFVDESGELLAARASSKIFQWPRRLGTGLCFEEAAVDETMAERVRALCARVGYYGVFETEFIEHQGRMLLIDFNPRFYGEMAFDIARGMPLPLFAWLAATGDRQRLRAAAERARSPAAKSGAEGYCNRFDLELLLKLQRMAGKIDREEERRWHDWQEARSGKISNPVYDRADWRPAVAQMLQHIVGYLRHPRAFYREIVQAR